MSSYIRTSDGSAVARPTAPSRRAVRGSWCIGDLMRPGVVVVRREDPLVTATGLLRARHASYAVVTRGRSIEGILAEHDLEALTWMVGASRNGARVWMNELAVEDVMRTPPVTIPPDATLGQASRLLRDSARGCLVVVSEGRPQAIVTEADIVRFLAQADSAAVVGKRRPAVERRARGG
jgi:CBS domain-containing protein